MLPLNSFIIGLIKHKLIITFEDWCIKIHILKLLTKEYKASDLNILVSLCHLWKCYVSEIVNDKSKGFTYFYIFIIYLSIYLFMLKGIIIWIFLLYIQTYFYNM